MQGLLLSSWCRELHGYVTSVKGKSVENKMRIKSAGYTMKEKPCLYCFKYKGFFCFFLPPF